MARSVDGMDTAGTSTYSRPRSATEFHRRSSQERGSRVLDEVAEERAAEPIVVPRRVSPALSGAGREPQCSTNGGSVQCRALFPRGSRQAMHDNSGMYPFQKLCDSFG